MPDTTFLPKPGDNSDGVSYKRIRNAVILPDGSKPVPLGSGVIASLLGVGGMANVYEIWVPQLEMGRAVKLLHPNYTAESKQRFETEVKITAKLNHPNIVEIHSVGDWNNLPYIEMEKIDGQTIEKLVVDRGGLPVEVCTSIGIMVCRALCYAHSHVYTLYGKEYRGIIHRDLKPNNIMVTKAGTVKLMDFGIAKPVEASLHTTDSTSVMGTIQYLSPEQLEGKNVDIRSDIYSLGAVLYELVTGVRAFPEINISKLMISKAKNDFKPLDSFAVRIPPKFKKAIQRCMSYDPGKRVQDAAALLEILTEIHKIATPFSPEQVMKQLVNAEAPLKAVIGLRNRLPLRIACAVVFFALIGWGVLLILKSGLFKTGSRQVSPVVNTQAPAPVVVVDRKKVDSLQSYINAMTARNSEMDRMKFKKPLPKPANAASQSPPAASAPNPDERMVEELKAQYATSDMVALFAGEVKAGHFGQASRIFTLLSQEQSQTKKAALFHLRLLIGLNDRDELKKALFIATIDDGEFYLEKARFYFDERSIAQCLANLELGSKTPCAFSDPAAVRQEILFYRALCYSNEYDANPSQARLKKAMDAWFDVKFQFRLSPDHPHYQKAVAEMQRLGEQTGK